MINDDFLTFTKLQLLTGDIDPAYPYLKGVLEGRTITEQLQFILLYMCSYNLSAALHYENTGQILKTVNGFAATGVERRANRGVDNMKKAIAQIPNNVEYVQASLPSMLTYSHGVKLLCAMDGYGRWAAFKLTEILDCVILDNKIYCDTLFTEQGSGHNKGLRELTGAEPSEHLAQVTYAMYKKVYPEYRYQNFETSLCDWHNLIDGKYYVGNDIDILKDQLEISGLYDYDLFTSLYPSYPVLHDQHPSQLRKLYQTKGELAWF